MDDVGGLVGFLGCKVVFLPMKYLGLPLEASIRLNLYEMVSQKK